MARVFGGLFEGEGSGERWACDSLTCPLEDACSPGKMIPTPVSDGEWTYLKSCTQVGILSYLL